MIFAGYEAVVRMMIQETQSISRMEGATGMQMVDMRVKDATIIQRRDRKQALFQKQQHSVVVSFSKKTSVVRVGMSSKSVRNRVKGSDKNVSASRRRRFWGRIVVARSPLPLCSKKRLNFEASKGHLATV